MYTVLPRILCVDDEPMVLEAMARNLRRYFDVTLAGGGEEGLDRIEREGPFAVVVSDQRMPGVDGVNFLARVREASPDTVRILLTGYADTAAAMGAVNRGAVFRFLSKPIDTAELLQTLTAAADQHRLVTAERVLLERTLHGSITAIIDVLALVNPAAFSRAVRAKEIASAMAASLGAPDAWQVEIAAMIAQVGAVAQSSAAGEDTRSGGFAQVESATVGRLSRIAADMVANIPRMEEVHAMLAHQELHYDGSNSDGRGPRERSIPLGGRILKVAFDLDTLQTQGMSRAAAVETMRGRPGWYDPQLLDALSPVLAPVSVNTPARGTAAPEGSPIPPAMLDVELRLLEPGMILGEDVRTRGGRVLIGKGAPATYAMIRQMKGALDFNELRQSVRVQQPAAEPAHSPEPEPMLPPPGRATVSAGGMQLDLTMRLTV